MRHIYRIITANVAIGLSVLISVSFAYLSSVYDPKWPIATGAAVLFGVIAIVVIRRTVRGYRKGYRSARIRNGQHYPKTGWPMMAFGYCFYSGFEAGERQWRRDHVQP